MSINPPATMFKRPFAAEGSKVTIPDTTTELGRASLAEGFPQETQMPIQAGGIPPHRNDFNGILNMITSHLFWMQSGGQWEWRSDLDYNPPAIVSRNGAFYRAEKASGPSVDSVGSKAPDNNAEYWVPFGGVDLTAVWAAIDSLQQTVADLSTSEPGEGTDLTAVWAAISSLQQAIAGLSGGGEGGEVDLAGVWAAIIALQQSVAALQQGGGGSANVNAVANSFVLSGSGQSFTIPISKPNYAVKWEYSSTVPDGDGGTTSTSYRGFGAKTFTSSYTELIEGEFFLVEWS